jgi:hypothetical protein
VSEKKIDLIAQLLAKAESTTPEEAEALTQHAERLMVKYMIDQATVDARRAKAGQQQEAIIEHQIEFRGVYRGEMINLASQVVYGLGSLRGMQYTGSGSTFVFWVVGFESDVAQAVTLINSLQIQATVAVRDWWKKYSTAYNMLPPYDQEKQRRSFVHGFGTGAGSRIRESRKVVISEAAAGTELVLVDRSAQVQAYIETKRTRRARARTATRGGAAAGYGYQAGKQSNTGGTGIGSGRKELS